MAKLARGGCPFYTNGVSNLTKNLKIFLENALDSGGLKMLGFSAVRSWSGRGSLDFIGFSAGAFFCYLRLKSFKISLLSSP